MSPTHRQRRRPPSTAKTEPTTPSPRPRRALPRWKRWCFRLTAMLLPLLALALAETALVLCGAGQDTALVVRVPGDPPELSYQLNEWADVPFYGVTRLAGPEPRRFDLPKPDDHYRVLVVGASTVYGFPYPPELAFPRQLELLLQQQNADRQVEVLNAGIVAISSFSVADLVRQGIVLQPDLIVVHAGHNEFYGAGGAASSAVGVPPALYPWTTWMRSLRLAQTSVGRLTARDVTTRGLMEALPRSLEIPWDDPAVGRAESNYRGNLERIVKTARRAGVPVVLTTVASNLRDHSPVSGVWSDSIPEADTQQWQALSNEGGWLAAAGRWEEALERYRQAAAIYDGHAVLTYRTAQALEQLERWDEAREAFALARDQDGCRFRAPGSFAALVAEVASAADDEGVYFLDLAALIAELSHPRAPGHDLYLEHVHYNFEGHWQLGLALARFVQTQVLKRDWNDERVPMLEERDELLGVIAQDHLAAYSFALQLMSSPPMNAAFDSHSHGKFLTAEIKQRFGGLSPWEQDAFADLPMDVIGADLLDALGRAYQQAGLQDEALQMFERNVERRPWSPEAYLALGRCQLQRGDIQQAKASARRALMLQPRSDEAKQLLRDAAR